MHIHDSGLEGINRGIASGRISAAGCIIPGYWRFGGLSI